MFSMFSLMVVWGVLTTILIILLIYRSTLTMREDDQLFLDEAESQMEQEQVELMRRVRKVNPLVRVFGGLSGLLIIVIAGVLVWALGALPLDATVQQIGKVCIIVVFVITLVMAMLSCLGLWHGAPFPSLR